MMLKDDFKPKEKNEDIGVNKILDDAKKPRGRPKKIITPKNTRIVELKRKVAEQDVCLKNKDKRLTKIETRWGYTKAIVWISLMAIGSFVISIGIYNFYIHYPVMFGWLMYYLGGCLVTFGLSFVVSFTAIWVLLKDEYETEDLIVGCICIGITCSAFIPLSGLALFGAL